MTVTDNQVKELRTVFVKTKNFNKAVLKSEMSEKTARKYLYKENRIPSEIKAAHPPRQYLTRKSPFVDIENEIREILEDTDGAIIALELFRYFQEKYPKKFPNSYLRSFQRLVKKWKVTEGPDKEIYFPQEYHRGEFAQSDFVHLGKFNIRINGSLYDGLLYHYALLFSKWEYVELCPSESFESLSSGFQNAMFESGGVPARHQTDSLTAAVNKNCSRDEFTDRYAGILRHYKIKGQHTNPRCPHEDGTIEQLHRHFCRHLKHALKMRGNSDFSSEKELEIFLKNLCEKRNNFRESKFSDEQKKLRALPKKRLDAVKKENVYVTKYSTVTIAKKTYSVPSKLIGQTVLARLFSRKIELWFGQKCIVAFDRLHGKKDHKINYRHTIKWFVRKPGAFRNYRYKSDMFPTTYFRMAFDWLEENKGATATKTYLKILELAAYNSESKVNNILNSILDSGDEISFEEVEKQLNENQVKRPTDVKIDTLSNSNYDTLLHKI